MNVNILGETGSMAGSDDAGMAWAASYDERASEVLGATNDLVKALENYGDVIIQAGFNHAVAEHNSTPGNQAPMPSKPADPQPLAARSRRLHLRAGQAKASLTTPSGWCRR